MAILDARLHGRETTVRSTPVAGSTRQRTTPSPDRSQTLALQERLYRLDIACVMKEDRSLQPVHISVLCMDTVRFQANGLLDLV